PSYGPTRRTFTTWNTETRSWMTPTPWRDDMPSCAQIPLEDGGRRIFICGNEGIYGMLTPGITEITHLESNEFGAIQFGEGFSEGSLAVWPEVVHTATTMTFRLRGW